MAIRIWMIRGSFLLYVTLTDYKPALASSNRIKLGQAYLRTRGELIDTMQVQ